MSIAYLLVALGLGVLGLAAWALLWAIDAGQYDDLERQGAMILEEEGPADTPPGAGPA
ncbi:MAG TPA: cbb3-type cytochrome oxidase assembly protein CcoS [Steroidobacteraceae bacterium]|nr:cbb3-type cytochrome oxidase assembly protein CcoS [Steroidobacteraceae bacterium]